MSDGRRIAVLTSGRQDFGILRSTCHALAADPRFSLQLVVTGMHLDAAHGLTVRKIEDAGLPIAARLDITRGSPEASAAALLEALPAALAALSTEALILVGDRSETAAAALGATLARVPIVHLHGGEETEGAIDNALRHAITKLAHLHLVSHEDHARRVRQLGEPDDTVHVVGAPGLDNLRRADLPDREALGRSLGLSLRPPVVAVTLHPTTLGAGEPAAEALALVEAMAAIDATWVISLPNNDAGAAPIRQALLAFAQRTARAVAVDALGERRHFGLLRIADAMLGNSSSAVIEAPAFQLPAVNVGDRQRGRLRGENLVDAAPEAGAITRALERALDPSFRAALAGTSSPFGDGRAAERIVPILAAWTPPAPPRKRFTDRLPSGPSTGATA